jgi:hypothetical protein
MKIFQKWGFGMAPPKHPVQAEREEAARTVISILQGEPVGDVEKALEHIGVVKGLFNRVAREDQWDWFYVKGQLGYPAAVVAKQIGFALGNLRGSLRERDEYALQDIRVGTKRLPILKCLSIFLGLTSINDEPNAGWVYILATREAPSFLKIGMTTRSVEERVREINSATGVLVPFGIWRCWRVMMPAEAEKHVHSALAEFRVRGDREFFAVEVSEAGKRISQVLDDAGLSLRTLDNLASLAS